MHRLGHPSLGPLGFGGQPGLGGLDVGIYHRIMATRPQNIIKFHTQWESSGVVCADYSSRLNTGQYTGVTLGDPGPADGRLCPFYDGLLDLNNIYTIAYANDVNGAAGTILAMAKMANVAVWSDGTQDDLVRIQVDANNYAGLWKSAVANTFAFRRRGGGTIKTVTLTTSLTDWMSIGMTWDETPSEMKAFFQGLQTGATQTAIGVWAGVPIAGGCVIGADAVPAATRWFGWISVFAHWNVALTPGEMWNVSRRI